MRCHLEKRGVIAQEGRMVRQVATALPRNSRMSCSNRWARPVQVLPAARDAQTLKATSGCHCCPHPQGLPRIHRNPRLGCATASQLSGRPTHLIRLLASMELQCFKLGDGFVGSSCHNERSEPVPRLPCHATSRSPLCRCRQQQHHHSATAARDPPFSSLLEPSRN